MIPELRPFQADLYERLRQARAGGARVIVMQAPTGAGKNTVAAYLVAQAAQKERRVLIMVHRRKLVDQISERLSQFEVQHAVLMRGNPVQREFRVQVASRDTLLSRCIHHEWVGLPDADLVLVDEAHHCGPASEYRKILANYPTATVVLITATPVDAEGRGLGPWAEALVCSEGAASLVKQGYLVPVRVYAPDRKRKGKKYVKGLAGDLVASWQAYGEGRPTVLFCARVKHSQDAVAAYSACGINAAHVDADTPEEERDQIFHALTTGSIQVVSNVGIIGEGVDIPELGCCQIFCEMGGRVRFLQACGRIMRPAPGKEYGILIDHAGAVFKHGFPDEDTEWLLDGSADEAFQRKHKEGQTEQALWCKHCQIAFHGSTRCPQCLRPPQKPPRSIFEPPPVEVRDEFLTEADRQVAQVEASRERKLQTWWACLQTAKKRNGTFAMASAMFRRKYNEWPPRDFPGAGFERRFAKVGDVYPNLGRSKA